MWENPQNSLKIMSNICFIEQCNIIICDTMFKLFYMFQNEPLQ